MNQSTEIDQQVLSAVHSFLENEKYAGQSALPADLFFIIDGSWLKDAAVIDTVNKRKGIWEVTLIFAHYKNPLRLIVRNITQCFSQQKALASAFYMRKEAAKDRRGTLNLSIDDLRLCSN